MIAAFVSIWSKSTASCGTEPIFLMSGLYNSNFSPARAASPQITSTNPDVDRYMRIYLSSFIIYMQLTVFGCFIYFYLYLVISTCRSCWRSITSLGLLCKFFPFPRDSWIKVLPLSIRLICYSLLYKLDLNSDHIVGLQIKHDLVIWPKNTS